MNKSEFDTCVEELRNAIAELPHKTEGLRMAEEIEIEIAKAKMFQWALDHIWAQREMAAQACGLCQQEGLG